MRHIGIHLSASLRMSPCLQPPCLRHCRVGRCLLVLLKRCCPSRFPKTTPESSITRVWPWALLKGDHWTSMVVTNEEDFRLVKVSDGGTRLDRTIACDWTLLASMLYTHAIVPKRPPTFGGNASRRTPPMKLCGWSIR